MTEEHLKNLVRHNLNVDRTTELADANSYPQIPATVWWGVRDILAKTPKAGLNENYIAAQLSVQTTAAKQYINELKRIGILSEDNKATDLALRWRMDETYEDAVSELVSKAYGEDLPNLAPTATEREKAVTWFKTQGLGEGSAKNKAATFFLVSSRTPGEVSARSATGSIGRKEPKASVMSAVKEQKGSGPNAASERQKGVFPVNLNLQIHISADASSNQIDAIFASMRKHLGNAQLS